MYAIVYMHSTCNSECHILQIAELYLLNKREVYVFHLVNLGSADKVIYTCMIYMYN